MVLEMADGCKAFAFARVDCAFLRASLSLGSFLPAFAALTRCNGTEGEPEPTARGEPNAFPGVEIEEPPWRGTDPPELDIGGGGIAWRMRAS